MVKAHYLRYTASHNADCCAFCESDDFRGMQVGFLQISKLRNKVIRLLSWYDNNDEVWRDSPLWKMPGDLVWCFQPYCKGWWDILNAARWPWRGFLALSSDRRRYAEQWPKSARLKTKSFPWTESSLGAERGRYIGRRVCYWRIRGIFFFPIVLLKTAKHWFPRSLKKLSKHRYSKFRSFKCIIPRTLL